MAYAATTNTSDASKPNFLRPEAVAVRPDLELMDDLLGGTRRLWEVSAERKYIRKWSDETADVYRLRRQCETLWEGFARVLSAAVGMLFAKPPALEWNQGEERMSEHWDNLDAAGTSGPVLAKRFSESAIRDGLALILVDHPSPPVGEMVTEAMAEELNLRPTWALYSRGQILSWRVGTVNNRAVPIQVVLHECDYAPAGEYGVTLRNRYRVLRLRTPPTSAGKSAGREATWELYEETRDQAVASGFTSVGSGVFRNKDGQPKEDLPIAIAYTGRTDAPFCASMPLLGVAFANLAHWQLSTELRFGRMVAAIEQPVVIGDLQGGTVTPDGVAIAPKLKLGWLTGVRVAQGGDYKWVGPSGAGLDQLAAGVKEKLEQVGQMGMSFLITDTRAAETAQAKLLDATAENSTLATAAQGIEDAINAALAHHAWYLGIEEEGVPVLTINKDFNATVLDPAVMMAYVQAAKEVGFPVSVLLREFQRGGRIPQDVDLDALELEMEANAAAEEERRRQEAEDRARQFGGGPTGGREPMGAGATA